MARDTKPMEAVVQHPDRPRAAAAAVDSAADVPSADMGVFFASVEQRAFRIVRAVVWDDHAALDVVQDSMMRLVEKYAQRPSGEWPALFFTILANRTRDVRRWRQLRAGVELLSSRLAGRRDAEGPEEDPMHGFGDPAPVTDPMRAANSRQLASAIEHAVDALPGRQREAFVLREVEGLDVRETARAMGCSEGSVKQHHFRALQALRGRLKEVREDD